MQLKLTILLLLFSLALNAQTKYEVATDGSGDYETITQLNTVSFSAGDTIAFRKGDTWSICDDARWVLDDNGTGVNPIVITSYGTGDKPILTARDSVDGMTSTGNWTDTGGNIWRYDDLLDQTQRFWVDGTEMTKALNASVTATFRWYYSGGSLYYYSTGNPASNYTLFQYTGQGAFLPEFTYVLNITGNYIKLSNVDLRGGYMTLLIYGDDITIDSCDIAAYVDENGIYWDGSDRGEIKNCTLDTKCTVDNQTVDNPTYTEDGINIRGRIDTLLIHNNYFKNWQHGAIHPQGGLNGVNDTIRHLWIYDNEFTAPDMTYGYAINYVSSTGTLPDCKTFRNNIHHIPLFVAMSCDGVEFYYNIIDSIFGNPATYHNDTYRSAGIFMYHNSGGAAFQAKNNKIHNNTFVDCEDAGIAWENFTGSTIHSNNSFSNNLFYNCGYDDDPELEGFHYSIHMGLADNEYLGVTNYQNNGMYSPYHITGDSMIYYGKLGGVTHEDNVISISEFNLENLIDNNGYPDTITNNFLIDTDSPFIDYEGGDYRLSSGSNLINGGIDLGYSTDYLSNSITETPDVGAYEYIPVSRFSGRISGKTQLIGGKVQSIRK